MSASMSKNERAVEKCTNTLQEIWQIRQNTQTIYSYEYKNCFLGEAKNN